MTQELNRIPGAAHYSSEYLGESRVFSFAHQIQNVVSFKARTVLEIGAGGGMVTAALRNLKIKVTTVDIQSELKPDVLGSVTDLPFSENEFDVVLCSQVLEHLPFDSVLTALSELRRVSTLGAVISVPDITRDLSFAWKLPLLGSQNWSFSLPRKTAARYREQRLETMGHYWEIGFPGVSKNDLTRLIQRSGWVIDRTWRVPELSWPRFFRLRHPVCSKAQSSC